MSPARGVPARRTTRTARATLPRRPTHRAGPIGGQPSGPPADNDTGLPQTPSGTTAPDAHGDTDTLPWNEAWDDSSKPKKIPEDPDSKVLHENDNGKPETMPDLDESTKATQKSAENNAEIAPLGQPAPVPLAGESDPSQSMGGLYTDAEDTVTKSKALRIDDPPSPADVPEDMRFDPEGEGTPGLMPPIPAPVPGDDDSKGSAKS
jgi:hypothetical protein